MQTRITTIIATSPIPSAPRIDHLKRTIESLQLVPELATSDILIACDAPFSSDQVANYDAYKENLENYCSSMPNTKMLSLRKWGHLSGVMERALEDVKSPFLFVQQHDLPLIRTFDCDGVIRSLEMDPLVKHVRLNKRENRPVGWDLTPLFGLYDTSGIILTRTGCWSDQSHLCKRKYYEDVILPTIRGKKMFPEDILNPWFKGDIENMSVAHYKLGTFLYGPPGHPAVIRHSDARNDKLGESI